MCGISGIIDFTGNSADTTELKAMTECIAHRGPDDSGFFSDSFVCLGHRRLSIIDLKSGHQPMGNEDKSIYIVYNGEIYNFDSIKSILTDRGHVFKTQCDTEVVIHAYEEWDTDCVERFNGMFSFVIYDIKKKMVLLVRDRLGIKPLYYAFVNKLLLFGSEMKSILSHSAFSGRPNLSALSSYLTFRYSFGDQTFFDGIKRLLPGHLMKVSLNGTKLIKYWEVPFHSRKEDLGEEYYLKKLKELLCLAVERRMISDVPLGAFLSGGLDSSIIVALMSKIATKPVKTFSIGFSEPGYNEYSYAKTVSDLYKTEHNQIMLSRDNYMELLINMIRRKDAPLSIPHEIALYQMSMELKKHITVVISGEGADELFGGYGRVQRSPMDFKKISFVNRIVPPPFKKYVISLLGANGMGDHWLSVKTHMDHFFSVYNWIPFHEKWSILTEDVNHELNYDQTMIDEWKDIFDYGKSGNPYDVVLYIFEKMHLTCLLDRLDMMTMAAGVEARVPFVDHELVEFVSTIPVSYKLKWRSPLHSLRGLFVNSFKASEWLDETKYILRCFAKDLLPPEIYNRKKLGFPVPLDSWTKRGQVNYAKEILLDRTACQRGIFRPDKIERLLNNPQDLEYDFWGKKIWMLTNVELWFREFIDR